MKVKSVKFSDLMEKAQYEYMRGLNRLMIFVECPNYRVISTEKAAAIGDTAFYFWNFYSKETLMPKTWDAAPQDLVAQYLHAMEYTHI